MSVEKLSRSFALPADISPREVDLFIPKASKDPAFLATIEEEIATIPTQHRLIRGDSRKMSAIEDESVHLVVTSPPYWTLKEYNKVSGQLGYVEDYEEFLTELDKIWSECHRVLVKGGRLVIVVGDVCLSRRKHGRHQVFPLHADIQSHCRRLGFDNLAPIFWYKIANASFEAEGNGLADVLQELVHRAPLGIAASQARHFANEEAVFIFLNQYIELAAFHGPSLPPVVAASPAPVPILAHPDSRGDVDPAHGRLATGTR